MKNRGFTMIEMALVILVGSIVIAGLLNILQTSIQTRTNQINYEASEVMKTSAVVLSISGRSITNQCVPGACGTLFVLFGTCVAAAPCPTYAASYPVPATASVAAQNDFWGNAMTYTPNPAVPSVSSSTPPTTVVFTLKSKGPDTVDGGADDISYVVTAAEFIARVSRTGL